MDFTISALFILLVMSWLTPIIALLIKLSFRGLVFFGDRTHGYMGVEFNCFKFRTMFVNYEADIIVGYRINDNRITKIGKFLRLTQIDQTPHLQCYTRRYERGRPAPAYAVPYALLLRVHTLL